MTLNKKQDFKIETAGSLMKDEYVSVTKDVSIEEAVSILRENVKDKHNIYYMYIVNQFNQLIGVLTIRELLAADGEEKIADVMVKDIVTIPVDEDQEEVASVFRDTDLVSMPVTNEDKQILGVIHVEDILDVMQLEATEDFHKMASMGTTPADFSEMGLMNASIGLLYRKRIVWLVVLVFMNVFSGAGIAYFEDIIASNVALVFFLPLLIDSGGNAGSQSATLVIRAMTIGDVKIKDWFKMFTKEISVSALMGFTMAAAVSVMGIIRGGLDIAVVVALTMTIIVIIGSLIGMSLPFVFDKLKLDPATASGPLITSIADIVGVLIYFSIASWYLSL